MFGGDGFMEYMGFRQTMVVEDEIEKCIDAIRNGADLADLDLSDLTEDERQEVEKEAKRRIHNSHW